MTKIKSMDELCELAHQRLIQEVGELPPYDESMEGSYDPHHQERFEYHLSQLEMEVYDDEE